MFDHARKHCTISKKDNQTRAQGAGSKQIDHLDYFFRKEEYRT
jgi:hypothetical protein